MEILDIVLIAILALAGFIGLFKGFLRSGLTFIFNLLSVAVGAGVVFGLYSIGVISFEGENFVKGMIIAVVAFIVGLIIGLLVFGAIRRWTLKARNNNGFRIFDGIFGMLVKMVIWVAIIWCVAGLATTLEGSAYDITDYINKTTVASALYYNNPLAGIMGQAVTAMKEGIGYGLVDILDMIMPAGKI